jgi:hypothetical protein
MALNCSSDIFIPERLGGGRIIAEGTCTTRYSTLCGAGHTNKTAKTFPIHSGRFAGPCHYCDVWGDTASLPALQLGSSGGYVKYLQMKLNLYKAYYVNTMKAYGFIDSLPVDGAFGAGTERAVKAFQSDRGLTSDGAVGGTTWFELISQATHDYAGSSVEYRPNCYSYSLSYDANAQGRYKESCRCNAWRNATSLQTLYNVCAVACDLQGCSYCHGVTDGCTSCNSYTASCACNASCHTAADSCNPNMAHSCGGSSCYGHTDRCPTNIDYQYQSKTVIGKAACPSYTACLTCNASHYGAIGCSQCDATQYGVACRQCNQTAYWQDDYAEDSYIDYV